MNNKESVYWKMRNGKLISVDDMDINHLRNVLKMIIRKSKIRLLFYKQIKQNKMNKLSKIEEDKSKFQKVETWKVVFHFHDAVEEISGTLDEIQKAINIAVFNNKDCTNFNCYKLLTYI